VHSTPNKTAQCGLEGAPGLLQRYAVRIRRFEEPGIHLRMDDGQGRQPRILQIRLNFRIGVDRTGAYEDEGILAIVPLDRFIVPEAMPEAVGQNIALLSEQIAPVLRPLLVDMGDAALSRRSARKDDDRGELDKRLDEACGRCSATSRLIARSKVLSN